MRAETRDLDQHPVATGSKAASQVPLIDFADYGSEVQISQISQYRR